MERIPADTQEKLRSWADKTTNTYEELANRYERIYEMLEAQGVEKEQINKAARFKVYQDIRGAVQSTAVPIEGILLGSADARDANAPIKQRILNDYRNGTEADQQRMLNNSEIKLDEEGNPIPLDPREKFGDRPNPNYRQEFAKFMVRPVVGLCRSTDDGGLKLTTLTLRQQNVDMDVPEEKPVEFLANVRTNTANRLHLTDSTLTQFNETAAPDLQNISWTQAFDHISDKLTCELDELSNYCERHSDDPTRVVATTGWITGIADKQTAYGNYPVFIATDEFDVNENAVSLWFSEQQYQELRENPDLGEGTELAIIGRPNLTGGGRLNINVYAFKPRTIMSLDALEA